MREKLRILKFWMGKKRKKTNKRKQGKKVSWSFWSRTSFGLELSQESSLLPEWNL